MSTFFSPGSPPLVRERQAYKKGGKPLDRITPARAGKTCGCGLATLCVGDHPRSCGKDSFALFVMDRRSGSPPLVRERLVKGYRPMRGFGITPARAGKTSMASTHFCSIEDHPRSCGKDPDCWAASTNDLGSPPLVRERLHIHNVSTPLL